MDAEDVFKRKSYEAYRDFRAEIEHIIYAKAKFHRTLLPTIIVYPEAGVEVTYNYTKEQQDLLNAADEAIERIRAKYEQRLMATPVECREVAAIEDER